MNEFEPNDLRYPQQDPRFAHIVGELTLAECQSWLAGAPPEPVFNTDQKENYNAFIQRQTAYALYRNEIVARRDALKLEEKRLTLPSVPFGEDVQAAIEWVQNTGDTPLEFLVKTYRNADVAMFSRINAASKVMDYVHRRLPAVGSTPVGGRGTAPSLKDVKLRGLSQLSDNEMDALEALLSKIVTPEAKS